MSDPYLYRTVRADWYVVVVDTQTKTKKIIGEHGPFPSAKLANEVKDILVTRLVKRQKAQVEFRETEVPIEPILTKAVQSIAERIEGWVDNNMIQNKKRRTLIHFHENVVRRSLKQMAKGILENTFVINKEIADDPPEV